MDVNVLCLSHKDQGSDSSQRLRNWTSGFSGPVWTYHSSPYHFGSKPQEWSIVALFTLSEHPPGGILGDQAQPRDHREKRQTGKMATQKVASGVPTLIPTTGQSVSASHTPSKSQRGQGLRAFLPRVPSFKRNCKWRSRTF